MLNVLKLENIKPMLVNLTGVRLLVIFSLLLESPKTAEEINEYFEKNNYPKEIFSIDTLRNDLNALRYAGCDISRADKSNNFKYMIASHPFQLNIDMDIAISLGKLYTKYYKYLPIDYLIKIENFFNILSEYTTNTDVCEYLKGISLIKKIDKDILNSLINSVKRKSTITFSYKAPYLGKVNYEFVSDCFTFKSKKLYIEGFNKTYNSSSYFLVSRIIKIISEQIKTEDIVKKPLIKVIYELKNLAMLTFYESEDEVIIEKQKDRIIVEFQADSNFKIIQKVLSYGPDCTVLEPYNIRLKIINELKRMYEVYND